MYDPRTAEGVEHLQTAALELLKAARSFLAVVEEVIEDPERLSGAAAGLADLVTGGFSRTQAPWQRAAWDENHRDLWGDDEPPEERSDEQSEEPPPAADTPTPRAPRPAGATPRAERTAPATSRVRRISVD